MLTTVRLDDIVEALEMQFDESASYLDLDTGQVVTVSKDLLRAAEDPGDEEPDLPTWQRDEWEIAKRIVSTDRFRELPTKFDVHEWAIMQDFSRSLQSDSIREDLLRGHPRRRGIPEFQRYRSAARHRFSLVWFPHGGPQANRTQLVRGESNRFGVDEAPSLAA